MIAWVFSLVYVIQQLICGSGGGGPRHENVGGGSSPGWSSSPLMSIVLRSIRHGVPVFNRASGKPSSASEVDRPIAGGSPARPPAARASPTKIAPRRNVPVVRITLLVRYVMPIVVVTATTCLRSLAVVGEA